ncbi:nickel transporter [Kitasatospora aureofaciens]|uniref:nickel transporter n=1 Tax=Kitasatospora aureofaciens TaxID=1894 RepID=UPI001C495529|nr:nickel transporter [Kitasatospora aureofaciens]MBV6700913.1 nickel transporter [Kitasatospora aureofaciens]
MNRLSADRAAIAAALLAFGLATGAPAAQAHPLGNFTVNRYDGLRLLPDRIEDALVVDLAEIPTAQEQAVTDTDHDGRISPAEAAARAAVRCGELAREVRGLVDGNAMEWTVSGAALSYRPGAADLPTARLTCSLVAPADLSHPAAVSFASGADPERLGWKEVSASGDHVRLTASDVPAASVSDELRSYPAELADRPLAVRSAELRTEPSTDGPAPAGEVAGPRRAAPPVVGEPVLFPSLERRLAAFAATRDLTVPVGLLALGLALLLGAGHAALPGHAKLAVAACLARRRGGVRAAVAVGATVTVTHTAGVLVTGLVLTASMSLVGEQLLGWLGAAGGALIAVIGAGLVVAAIRTLAGHRKHDHHHDHHHGHHDHHDHHHHSRLPLLGIGLAGGLVPSPSALVILLGAVALGRTSFGVLLVLGYGLGMALALTAAGLLLSGTTTRLATLTTARLPSLRRYAPYASLATALVVLAVGLGLALRSVASL